MYKNSKVWVDRVSVRGVAILSEHWEHRESTEEVGREGTEGQINS